MPDDPLLEISGGDPAQAESLRRALQQLASRKTSPELKEMATEVLEGRQDLRTAALSGAYDEALTGPMQEFTRWRRELSPEEMEEQLATARDHLDRLREELEAQSGGAGGPASGAGPGQSGSGSDDTSGSSGTGQDGGRDLT